MNKHLLKPQPTPYEADYAQWCAEQGALLREGRLSDLDRENLADEIESLGRSDKREIRKRLGVLLAHLLKWQFQADKRNAGWLLTIREQRRQIKSLTEESPSLKTLPRKELDRQFELARQDALDETGLSEVTFPEECPYTIGEVLDFDYFPGAPWSPEEIIRD
jgi:uncharacterized protein DUF29